MGKAHPFQSPQPSDLHDRERVWLPVRRRRHVDDTVLVRVLLQLTVQLGPAFCLDLAFNVAVYFLVGARPEFKRHQVLGASTQSLADVIPGYDQILAVLVLAPHDDVDMRIVGVPMRHGNPVQLRAEILFGLRHQFPREGFQVRHLSCILWSHDEAEMMSVILTPLGEFARGHMVALGPEQPGLLPVLRDTFALEIGEMGTQGRPCAMPDHPRLDEGKPGAPGQETIGTGCRSPAPPESGRSLSGTPRARTAHATRPVGRGQHAADEGPPLADTGQADAARPDPEIVITGHEDRDLALTH
ncbi:hypothetical protein KMAL_29120 [Novacetimonas maltaceti]|uniref:Uncharacterized protein n=1 Tax=Novacetimonas maltaceti TaxID=1203393 RepID=A0A2S3VXZ0_9PROT|nr:hypothetical protein KMAL_29120 [Novacetimonas maltaceti]